MDFVISVRDARLMPPEQDSVVATDVRLTAGEPVDARTLAAALAADFGMPSAHLLHAGHLVGTDQPCGEPPLVHGASFVLAEGRPDRSLVTSPERPRLAPFDLTVVSGPDCGHRVPLGRDAITIGRGHGSVLALDDDALSREHAVLTVDSEGVTLADLGSTNGVVADGHRVESGTRVDRSSRITLGHTEIRLRRPAPQPRPLPHDGSGFLRHHAAPAADSQGSRHQPVEMLAPTTPAEEAARALPWFTMIVPLPIAGILAFVLGPQFLLFALLGPAMMGATWWHDRRGRRHRIRSTAQEYSAALTTHEESVREHLAREAALLDARCPDAVATLDAALTRAPGLWSRSPSGADWLQLRLGSGDPPATTIRRRDQHGRVTIPRLSRAPVVVSLAECRSLTVVGSGARAGVTRAAVFRHLVGQLATWHSPADLALICVGPPDGPAIRDRSWLRWLPQADGFTHVGIDADRLREVVSSYRRADRSVVILLPDRGACPSEVRAAADGLALGTEGVHLLAGDDLPPGSDTGTSSGATLTLTDSGDRFLTGSGDTVDPVDLAADGVGPWWVERLARALAPLRPQASRRGEAPITAWSTLGTCAPSATDTTSTISDRVLAQWDRLSSVGLAPATALIGNSPEGAFSIDLDRDGPHLLIGGTTGSGKSEVLRALVLGLATTCTPSQVTFLLVDYKGGSTFTRTRRLPHTVGVVSDLDPHLAQRALRSLRAEVTRRERLFAAAEAADLETYAARIGVEPIPRLVVMVDEFRVLAEEQPDFLAGLVRLAAVGRSMGIHLVLATQRPAGAITPDIQANVNLRIALRVRDAHDSEQVIGSPSAAGLDPLRPGSGLARHADGTLTAFRAVHPSGHTAATRVGVRVTRVGPDSVRADAADGDDPGSSPSDEERIVDAIIAAAARADQSPPRRPWLPGLDPTIDAHHLPDAEDPDRIPIGVVDLPDEQRQESLCWSPTDQPWRFVGGPRSGRTTALRTLVTQAVHRLGTDQLEVYAVASAPAMLALATLPHVAAVVSSDDPGRMMRLVTRLRREAELRRATAGQPTALVVIDDWDHVLGADQPWTPLLEPVLREIAATPGMSLVAAGGRVLTTARALSGGPLTVMGGLELSDLLLVGLRAGQVPTPWPPGRAVRMSDRAELHVALPPSDVEPRRLTRRRPEPVLDLPTRLPLASVEASTVGVGALVIGVADGPALQEWDAARSGRTLLVTGPPGSGRTNALSGLAAQARRRGRSVIVIGSRTGGCWPEGSVVVAPGTSLAAALENAPRPLVVVDDSETLPPAAESDVSALVDDLERRDALLAVASGAHLLGTAFRGLVPTLAGRGHGLLLAPTGAHDGGPFGVRIQVPATSCPGRGIWLSRGGAVEVQVPMVEDLVTSASRP